MIKKKLIESSGYLFTRFKMVVVSPGKIRKPLSIMMAFDSVHDASLIGVVHQIEDAHFILVSVPAGDNSANENACI